MVLTDKRSSSVAGIEHLSSGDSAAHLDPVPVLHQYTFCHADEETGTHHSRNFTNRSIERHRIVDAAERAVEDVVAVVADKSGGPRRAQPGLGAEPGQPAPAKGFAEGENLDR